MLDETSEVARRANIDELSDVLFVAQKMGRRLANATHGDAYANVRELNEFLHEARIRLLSAQDIA